jgi:hypothetical protein
MIRLTALKIDVSKLKHQVTTTSKGTRVIQFSIDQFYEGQKGIYLDITGEVNDDVDKYGNNGGIWLSQTKEQRESEEKKVYLGNTKVLWSGERTEKGGTPASAPAPKGGKDDDDDLPF